MITTYDDFVENYLLRDGMLADEVNLNRPTDQLKKEIMDVISNLSSLANSKQVLDLNDAISINGKRITIKKGDGSEEFIDVDLFDEKMNKINSINNRVPKFNGTSGDLSLTSVEIDNNENLVVPGSITSNTGLLNGNSSTTSRLKEPINITLSGGVSGTVSFDGSSDINLTSVITANSHSHLSENISDATSLNTPVTLVKRDSSGNFSANKITADLLGNANTANVSNTTTGNAGTATKLQNPKNISLGGVLTGQVSFDGSSNVVLTATHNSSPSITLTGGVTGTATMTNLGNVSINTTITNDSHTHDSKYYSKTDSDLRYVNSAGDSTISGQIYPSSNATIDFGHQSFKWKTIYGTATAATYADLAEKYLTDKEYGVGTVLEFGGEKELTLYNGGTLAGVISENPGFILNEESTGQLVALKGKTPVQCIGTIKRGQYCIATDGKVKGVDKKDMTFELTLDLVGIALEDSKNNRVMVKI